MLRDQIAELEADIEDLSLPSGAGKSALLPKCWWLAVPSSWCLPCLGLWRLGRAALVVSLAAILGGIALYWSNKRTRDDTMAAIRVKEADRAALIDALGLHDLRHRHIEADRR
jgi:hypothetical protein